MAHVRQIPPHRVFTVTTRVWHNAGDDLKINFLVIAELLDAVLSLCKQSLIFDLVFVLLEIGDLYIDSIPLLLC